MFYQKQRLRDNTFDEVEISLTFYEEYIICINTWANAQVLTHIIYSDTFIKVFNTRSMHVFKYDINQAVKITKMLVEFAISNLQFMKSER